MGGMLSSGGTSDHKTMPPRERTKSSPTLLSMENLDLPRVSGATRSSFSRNSNAEESDAVAVFGGFGSIDVTGQALDFSGIAPSPPRHSSARTTVGVKCECSLG